MNDLFGPKGMFDEGGTVEKYFEDVIVNRHHDSEVGYVRRNGDIMSHQKL